MAEAPAPAELARRAAERLRLPPHSVEAEQSLLGGLMLDQRAWDQIADVVSSEDLYRADHRLIFAAVAALVERNQPPDAVTVSEHLQRLGQLEAAGGLPYLARLVEDTPSAANIRAYARIVRDHALLRRLIEIGGDIAASAHATEGLTAAEIVDRAEQLVFEIAERGQRGPGFVSLKQILPKTIDRIDFLSHSTSEITGVSTGFVEMDKMTSGLQRGELVIIAGRPSMGKSTLAVNIAEHAALGHKIPAAIFSMEMSAEQLSFRMLSSIGRIEASRLRNGKLLEEDWPRVDSAVSMMSEAPIFIDDSGALTPTEVRARARRLKREHGLGLIVIDYLQLMQVPGTVENRATEISEISRSLKALAKELDVPVIALSQLNRSVEQRQDKRPVMSDLRECVTGDTLVCLTDGRRVPIRDLVDTEPRVWSVDKNQRLTAGHADKVWKVGRKAILEVKLASGRSIRATREHRLLAGKGWATIGELTVGDRIALARRIPEPQETGHWPDHALILLGHLVGDGSYLKHQPLRYTTASEANSTAVREAAEAFGSTVKRHAGRGAWHQLVISGNGNRWMAAGVGRWLKDLEIFGQRSHEKHLPAAIFTLPDEQIALLLRHLWATDGSVTLRKPNARGAPRVYFSTVSAMLAHDVAALLLRLGIVARIRTVHSTCARPMYTVDVSGSDSQMRFAEIVGGFGPRALAVQQLRDYLVGVVRNTNVDTLPEQVMQRVCALMREQGIGRAQMAAIRGYKNINIDHAPSRRLIAEYAAILNDEGLQEACESELFWDRVVALNQSGEEDVYDLTVPGEASWLADGIVSHNSGAIEQDADLILFIYREEVYEKDTPRKGIADIIIAKQRNGPVGDFRLTFLGQYTKFENLVAEAYGEGVF